MRRGTTSFLGWWLIILLAGCAAYRIAGQVQAGRQALLINKNETALADFQQAAESSPDYIFESGSFREGIWTYLGRAQYQMGRLAEARSSLERALMVDENDDLARLYLGLTLARGGDRSTALNAIVNGLEGLRGSLEYRNASDPFRAFWDPGRKIRGEIEKALDMISGKDIDWGDLISRAEWVGREIEEEVDRVRRDERQWFQDRDQGIRSGVSIGIGIGF